MKQQIVTIVLGAAVMLGTATSLFAQTSGVAVGGGAAGGPNGIYKDPYGQSIVDQMVIYAPVASQVYQRNVELGEYVSPGVPLVTLVDLSDVWIHFDLREDLVKTLKIGDRFGVRIPALSGRRIRVEVKLIAPKGEYASWLATRTTGDSDLRTFSIRAYPVDRVPQLRPGMSAYLDWRDPG